MKILVVHGPNLNLLGHRDASHYGRQTLAEIDALVQKRARELGAKVATFQSNSEGALIDFIQKERPDSQGIIINPGAYTHYGLALRDALADTGLPIIEVHLSNIHAREGWRRHSVIAPIARGQISGLKGQGYIAALEALVALLQEEEKP
ncbi:MAG: type II 3-dehydroquinate dehydratase [Chloroflexi bacterium]|nr:type II 3-dehydroquinate dehydratase [Chloroflexota bacterium]